MQNSQNYVEIEAHNKIMQSLRQRELQYKTKIIELQKQKEYESNRANEFQQKFKEALLISGDQVSLIEKLSQKENENNELRIEIIKLKKSIDQADNSSSNKGFNDLAQTNKQLMMQNQQLANTIEELKNAAISAIMAKDDQIDDLNEKIVKAQDLAVLYQNMLERQENLEKQIEKIRAQAEQQQKLLSQKLAKERQRYLQKLEEFQSNLQHQQSSKEQLMQKTELLETNLENKQQVIFLYQNKLNEYDSAFRQEKQIFEQEKEKLSIQIDNLKDKHTLYEKQISNLEKMISQYSFKEKESKILNQRLRDENSELQRKLTIKKRKHNPKMKSSDIYSSFEGISQKSSFYSSFYKPNEAVKPSNLGQIEEMEENDVLDSFIDLEQRPLENNEQYEISHKKTQKTLEVEISPQEEQNENISTQQQKVQQPMSLQQLPKETVKETEVQSQQSKILSAELQSIKQKLYACESEIKTLKSKNQTFENEAKSLKTKNDTFQTEIKSLKQRNDTLKKNLDESYSEIERLTKQIFAKTVEIQNERQTLAQLRSQNKKSQSQKQLMVELQNFKQHVFKLQNALLIEKLQNAQKEEFMKQRNERERKTYQDKIHKLDEQVKNLSPKKKKGFFR